MADTSTAADDPYTYAASLAPAATSSAADDDPYTYAAKAQTVQQNQENLNPAAGDTGLLDLGVTTVNVPGWLERGLEGTGKAFVDIGRGVGERVGLVTPEQIAADRAMDAPLMATTAGKVGNVVGNIAATAPAMFVPGVNTAVGGAVAGGLLGAAQPTTAGESVAKNTLFGAAAGGLGTGVGNRVADWAGGALASRLAASEQEAAVNAERDAVLMQGRAVGLKVPPTAVNPNLTNTAVESVAGKAATRQGMQAANSEVFNKLTAQDLGLPTDQPLTLNAIKAVRNQAGMAYDAVKNTGKFASDPQYNASLQQVLANSAQLEKAYPGMSALANTKVQDLVKAASVDVHDATSAVDFTKFLRNQASANFKSAFRTGDPQTLELAHAQQGVANAVEDLIGRHLDNIGQPELAQQWQDARTTIAKSYQAQAALKGNNIDALRLAKQVNAGKPMTGGMGLVGKFATHFPEVSSIPKSGPGVSKLAFMAGMLGEGGAAYLHSPELAAGGLAAIAAPYAVRKGITSAAGQALLATPKYPSLAGLLSNQVLRGAQLAGRSGLLAAPIGLNPAIPK
jgi:hypothetical protein